MKLLLDRQKDILLAGKSESACFIVEEYKKYDVAENSDDEKRLLSAERRARATSVVQSEKEKKQLICREQKIFA